MTEISLERGRRVLSEQPFSVLVGSKMQSLEEGQVELVLDLRKEHMQQHGFAHGGVVSYLADNTLTFAGGTVLGDSVTLEYKINFVRPAIGERLIARARVTSGGRSQAVCQCDIFAVKDGVEKLCATAQGTIWKVAA
ncbi:MAG: PaaI family thioesterase [Proteobacteria bacterium]|nr:PaaI family thioesterase [Pseudomonadota bacterium]